MSVKAIETRYAGCHFRSRLEARWAVFFDTLGIPWQYEVEGYETPDGRYLPDFLLTLAGGEQVWFEIKPKNDTTADPRWRQLAEGTGRQIFVAHGMPRPEPFLHGEMSANDITLEGPGYDNYQGFCQCPDCDLYGITFGALADKLACKHRWGLGRFEGAWNGKIIKAYVAAHSARFEHGQHGTS